MPIQTFLIAFRKILFWSTYILMAAVFICLFFSYQKITESVPPQKLQALKTQMTSSNPPQPWYIDNNFVRNLGVYATKNIKSVVVNSDSVIITTDLDKIVLDSKNPLKSAADAKKFLEVVDIPFFSILYNLFTALFIAFCLDVGALVTSLMVRLYRRKKYNQ